ncbi:MAG: EamA family transporter [Deltaproteobacteria bacterium]|nr:EamA family transporter [Deltaproteobacteria bacterium]
MNEGRRSRVSIALAALLWSTGGTAIKLAGVGGAYVAVGRAALAALTLLAVLPESRRWPTPRMALTALAYAVTCTLFVFANIHTTAASAIFIQNTAPVWVLLMAPWVTGERPTRAEIWSLPPCLIGAGLFFVDAGASGRLLGNALAAAASLTYAVQISMYRKLSTAEGLAASVWGNFLLVLVVLPFAGSIELDRSFVLAILWLGIFQQALAVTLFIRGIRGVSALEAALLTLLEPVLAPAWAYLFLGETIGFFGLLGGGLIMAATLWRMRAK